MIYVADHRDQPVASRSPDHLVVNLWNVDSPDPYRSDNAYAEMRVHYAVWKDFPAPWVGFEHYRRYLCLPALPSVLIADYDIITSKPKTLDVRQQYIDSHDSVSWTVFEAALAAAGHPWRDLDELHQGNLYLLRWEKFNEYMTLWSAVMAYLAQRITPVRGDYQERVFGFLSERLWSLWYSHQTGRHLEVDITLIDEEPRRNFRK